MQDITPQTFDLQSFSQDRAGLELSFETGKLAPQADGAVVVTLGQNSLLCTAVLGKRPDMSKDFTPLMIDRRDYYPAVGKIGGGQFRKREGRPSDNAVLYARMTDRVLRPLFPKGMVNEIVVSVTPLCVDKTQDLGAMSIIGCSAAVMAAGVPFNGPAGAVRIGRVDGQFVINPTKDQIEAGDLNLLVAGPQGLTNMIECDAKQIPDALIDEAFALGQTHIDQTIDYQRSFLTKLTITTKDIAVNKASEVLLAEIGKILTPAKLEAMMGNQKVAFNDLYFQYEQEVLDALTGHVDEASEEEFTATSLKMGVFALIKKAIRHRTLHTEQRYDNRPVDQVRPLYSEVGLYPRTHGTGLFRRGDTQVLTTATLGSPGDVQKIDDMEHDGTEQRYIHHYNFPPFSVNDARGTRGAGRREIGHGALAEKALVPVIPNKEEFPYTIRLVSECLSSGGSTSQASVCGSTLALMDAGVPISAPVAGIAMGLMTEYDDAGNITKYKVLTDLAGTEDFIGDMDFKVAGTQAGITAIQLDTKIPGLTYEIIKQTIAQAHTARNQIMEHMLEAIPAPRPTVNKYAPKMFVFKIHPDKIREVIGKGGEVINKIIELAGGEIKIDFDDEGLVFMSDVDQANIDKALELIKDITEDLPLNTPLEGTISRVENYGVFVNLPRKKSGLCHVKYLGAGVDVEKTFKIGQKLQVVVTEVDKQGRLVLKKA